MNAPFQWIDVDPFGSPVSFLDSAIQSISRVGVLRLQQQILQLCVVLQKRVLPEGMALQELLTLTCMMMQQEFYLLQ